jgi:hypothetical protein
MANILLNLAPVITATVNVLNGSFTGRSWAGVGAHAISLAIAFYLIAGSTAAQEQAGRAADPARVP